MGVRFDLKVLGAILLSAVCLRAHAAHTQVQLVLAAETARPGDTVLAGVHLKMEPRWHTYWRNPGESGMATKIAWQLPPGVTVGEIQWPLPEKTTFAGLTTYDYQDETVLLVTLKLADGLPAGPLELKAKVSWLECQEVCIPGSQEVSATLTIAGETKSSADAGLIESWQKKIPPSGSNLSATGAWETAMKEDSYSLVINWSAKEKPPAADFLPYENDSFDVAATNETLPYRDGKAGLRIVVSKTGTNWPPTHIGGVLVQKFDGEPETYEINLPLPSPPAATMSPAPAISASLWQMLVFAFLGGLILNIMPCVFPVIALKIFGFVQQSRDEPRQVFRLGLIYGLGVLVSFLVLAGAVIAVQRAGGAASWGMQLQNPQFSLALTVLVTLVALNLFGLFEVTLGGSTTTLAGQLAAKPGAAGAFFNGVLATALATPCTAPFLAPALGFAFVQPPAMIVLFFATIAVGLAAPYVILSWQPAWLKFLPKPGAWMEKFKIAMGFPMLATAIWLFSFTAKRFGTDGPLWVGLFLVMVALAAWIWGDFVQRGRRRQGLAAAISLLLLAVGYGYGLEKQLHWRAPVKSTSANEIQTDAAGITWQRWSAAAVEQARAEGRPVLVDFTADWCLTCLYNKRTSIEVPAVAARLKEINAATFIGDNTDNDPAIVAELKKFGRAGVPLVLVYPPDASSPPFVLPALLTKGIMLDALNKVAR
jgi:thiol:disulfide interchange protein/DsbC/DsbD-like thiol-disulfide interchange protein